MQECSGAGVRSAGRVAVRGRRRPRLRPEAAADRRCPAMPGTPLRRDGSVGGRGRSDGVTCGRDGGAEGREGVQAERGQRAGVGRRRVRARVHPGRGQGGGAQPGDAEAHCARREGGGGGGARARRGRVVDAPAQPWRRARRDPCSRSASPHYSPPLI